MAEPRTNAPEVAPPVTASPPLPAPPTLSPDGGAIGVDVLAEGWPRIRADVKAVSRRIEAILQQIDPVAVNGNQLLLVSPYEFHRNRVNTDEVRMLIEDVILRQFNVKLSVQCLTRAELAAMPANSGPTAAPPVQAAPQPAPAPHSEQRAAEATPQPSAPASGNNNGTANGNGTEDRLDPIDAIRNIFDAEVEPE
jgi:DNA polymerase-3 subunit gamma/tau